MNTKTTRPNLIAQFAIGAEAINDGIGAVCIEDNGDGTYELFVNGGDLPTGEASHKFEGGPLALSNAMTAALDLCKAIFEDDACGPIKPTRDVPPAMPAAVEEQRDPRQEFERDYFDNFGVAVQIIDTVGGQALEVNLAGIDFRINEHGSTTRLPSLKCEVVDVQVRSLAGDLLFSLLRFPVDSVSHFVNSYRPGVNLRADLIC
jgi:hypothetical protein